VRHYRSATFGVGCAYKLCARLSTGDRVVIQVLSMSHQYYWSWGESLHHLPASMGPDGCNMAAVSTLIDMTAAFHIAKNGCPSEEKRYNQVLRYSMETPSVTARLRKGSTENTSAIYVHTQQPDSKELAESISDYGQ